MSNSNSTYTKHTTHTDALDTLGTIIGPNEGRDAIHLAVEPVQAGHHLWRGADVALGLDGKAYRAEKDEAVGIVDPFLTEGVEEGQWFWLVVYPRQITSLRHVWEHPAFPKPGEPPALPSEPKKAAEKWLRDFLLRHGDNPGFDAVMAVIRDGSWDRSDGYGILTGHNWGEYIHFNGTDAHGDIPAEFWDHVEVYLGRKIPTHDRAGYFSCSC